MRRTATVILVVLVLLAAGGAVADRVVVDRTEQRLLAEARTHVDLADGSDVVIEGFPFLTQVVAGRLAEVRGHAPALVMDGVELRNVRVAARGVQPEEPYRAETVEINVVLPAETLRSRVAAEVDVPGDALRLDVAEGSLQLGVEVAGREVTALLEPVVVDGAIGVRLGEVMVGDAGVPDRVVRTLGDLLTDVRLEVPGLPAGLVPTRVAVEDDGLHVRLEGTGVELGAWVASGS